MTQELIVMQPDGSAMVVDWRTGEALDIATLEVPELLEFRTVVKDELTSVLGLLDDEVITRLDRANRRQFHIGDTVVYTQGGESIEWDGHRLYRMLGDLESEGVIDPDAIRECVKQVQSYQVNAAAAKRLLNHHDERVRDVAEQCAVPKTTKRGVRTRRVGGKRA